MDALRQDLRYAIRQLRRTPAVTLVAVLSIALGIGANTLVFSFISSLLLRPLPFPDADRLVTVRATNAGGSRMEGMLSWPDYADFRRQATSFSEVGGHITGLGLTLTAGSGGGEAERVEVEMISANLFPLLGIEPMLGRNIREDEDRPGKPLVILLSHRLWQRRFGGDPKILGRKILGNGQPYEVIGVMPPGFEFPIEWQDGWVPLESHLRPDMQRIDRTIRITGRLRPGVSVDEARAAAELFGEELARTWPRTHTGWRLTVLPLRENFVSPSVGPTLWLALGAVLCILLIACANVANLLLARALARHREMAVRMAFGASPRRILRQMLTESLVIAGAGGALGLVLALLGSRIICEALPLLPSWISPQLDGAVLAFTLVTTVASGLLFGMAPALRAARMDLHSTLKDGARSSGSVLRNRLRIALVIAELAVAMVVLVGAALFLRSFLEIRRSSAELAREDLLSVWIYLPGEKYEDDLVRARKVEDVLRRLAGVPGIEAGAAATNVPFLMGAGFEGPVEAAGRKATAFSTSIGSGFFETLGVQVTEGRDLTPEEAATLSGAAVVNETLARQLWPRGAVGQRFRLQTPTEALDLTVVGVAAFTRTERQALPRPEIFIPLAYYTGRPVGLVVRTSRRAEEILPDIRRAIRSSDSGIPLFQISTLAAARDRHFSFERLFGLGFALFGAGALFLASIGVYGMFSYLVSQRLREIGIRLALGAGRWNVVRLVVGQGLLLTFAGMAIGLAAALLATPALGPLLFKIDPSDPLSFAGVAVLLVDMTFIACYLPARRALEVEPVEVLRGE